MQCHRFFIIINAFDTILTFRRLTGSFKIVHFLSMLESNVILSQFWEHEFNCCYKLKNTSCSQDIRSTQKSMIQRTTATHLTPNLLSKERIFSNEASIVALIEALNAITHNIQRFIFTSKWGIRAILMLMITWFLMSYLYFSDSTRFDGRVVGTSATTTYGNGLTDSSVKEVVIPATNENKNVVELGQYSFLCKGITSIFIPKTVKRISRCAFQECSSLTEVKFEADSSLTECGDAVFYQCTSLKKIDLPPSLSSVETLYNYFQDVSLDCFSYSGTHDFASQSNFFTTNPKIIHVSMNYPSAKFAKVDVSKDGLTCGVNNFITLKRTRNKCSVCRRRFTPHYFMYMFLLIQS